jgi:peptidoglycan/xylan/chitin deacetylase (PgdA/CDA1 family)
VPETRPLAALIGKVHVAMVRLGRVDRRPQPGAVPLVLMYHSISTGDDPYRIAVSPARFAEQMRWLRRRGLRGTSMRELLDAADRGAAAGLVGLTFDDGYADFTTQVLPVLARNGFTATVFVIAGKLGGCNDWDEPGPVRPLMTADEVCIAARMGIEVGSHGLGHVRLSEADAGVLDREVRGSREILESRIGVPVQGFCYPYGDLSGDAVGAARAGYDYAVATGTSGCHDRYALPRTYVGERDGPARLYAKWFVHRLTWGPGLTGGARR